MRKLVLMTTVILSLIGCQNQDARGKEQAGVKADTTAFTRIKWTDSVQDIGTVEAGKKAEIQFRFRNTGAKPLFIISAEPGCGCTIAGYPKQAIAPGAEGMITAAYEAPAETTGAFRKNIHVKTNTKDGTDHYIYFYGVIQNRHDKTDREKIDTATLRAVASKELKRSLLLKPNKN